MRILPAIAICFTLLAPLAAQAPPAIADAGEVRRHFASSDYAALRRTDEEFLQDVYAAVLGRGPDAEGMAHWLKALQGGLPRAKAVDRMLESPESTARRTPPDPSLKNTIRRPGNVLFDRTGLFINSASAFPPDTYADLVKLGNVAWITLQIDNGGKPREDNVGDLRKGWADRWRAKGVKVGFWGCPRGPEYNARKLSDAERAAALAKITPVVADDARLAARLTAEHQGDFYIADLEGPFQDMQGDPALNRVYVEAFDAAADLKLPRALSSMGRVALDMTPWIEGGWDAMPQAYWNAYAHYRPSLCMDFYVRERGWPPGRVHPTIATYRGEGEDREVTLEQYAEDLRTSGATGFSYYLPESYLRTEEGRWRQIGLMGR